MDRGYLGHTEAMNLEAWMPVLFRTWKGALHQKSSAPLESREPPPGRAFAPGRPGARPGKPGKPGKVAEVVVQGPGRAYPSEGELFGLADSVKRLTRGFTGYRNKIGSLYLDDPNLLGAYLLYYWPISYLQARSVISGLLARGMALPSRILDCGSGPGPVAFALADAKREQDPKAKITIKLLDHSAGALDMAKALALAAYADDPLITVTSAVWDPLKAKTATAQEQAFLDEHGPWDSISFGHSLNELWKDKPDSLTRRSTLLSQAARNLGAEGMVFVLEPALREFSDTLIALRDGLVASGHPVLAPCLFQGPKCPALLAGQTCHGQSHLALPLTVQKLAGMAGLDKDSVAMAYLVFGSLGRPWPEAGSLLRVLSEPMMNKAGRTRYMVCTPKGRLSFSGKLPDPNPGAPTLGKGGKPGAGKSGTASGRQDLQEPFKTFASLRRDDLLEVQGTEDREGGIGLLPDSRISKK